MHNLHAAATWFVEHLYYCYLCANALPRENGQFVSGGSCGARRRHVTTAATLSFSLSFSLRTSFAAVARSLSTKGLFCCLKRAYAAVVAVFGRAHYLGYANPDD